MIINDVKETVFLKNLLARKKGQILIDAKTLLGDKSWQITTCLHIIMKQDSTLQFPNTYLSKGLNS
jgi:hypothetical protein